MDNGYLKELRWKKKRRIAERKIFSFDIKRGKARCYEVKHD